MGRKASSLIGLQVANDKNPISQDITKILFPIVIDGIKLDESLKPAADASKTDYVLVQTWKGLSSLEVEQLVSLKHIDYVSKNTYLGVY